jgi:hypothetical protein
MRSPGPLLLTALAAAVALFAWHAWLYGGWITDDAGISFTYARNLASGNGLVLNPGGERVEGYSNPAWVFLLALTALAGLFDPVVTPKVLAGLLTIGSFWLLARISGRLFGWPTSVVHALPALLLACSIPWVSWSISGLENSLFGFLLAGALHLHLGETDEPERLPWSALLFFLLAITRPEGIIYGGAAIAHRMALLPFRPLMKTTAAWGALFLLPFAAYHAWHFAYFADWLPNTYYAKVERGSDIAWRLDKELANSESTGWKYVRGAFAEYRLGWVLLPGALLSLARFRRRSAAILLVTLVAILNLFYAIYVGGDWMDEYRFLGPTFLVTCLMAAGGVLALRPERDPSLHDPSRTGTPLQGLSRGPAALSRRFRLRTRRIPLTADRRSRRLLSVTVMSAAAVAAAAALLPPNARLLATGAGSMAGPSVSFARVEERGRGFAELARSLFIEEPSLMDPDLGGTSWGSGLRMIDLGGLADAHIARYGYDPRFFVPYVLDERRPTFVRTHCVWSRDTRINEYPAFRAAYLPLWEKPCPLECCGDHLDGEYIRKDVFVAAGGAEIPEGRRRNISRAIALAAWETDRSVAAPGQAIILRTWWSSREDLPSDLTWSVRLVGPGGAILAESFEFTRGIYPPSSWAEGETVLDLRSLAIPRDVRTAAYRLELSVRGMAVEGTVSLGEIEVDAQQVREEGGEFMRFHQRAISSGDPEGALTWLERAVALRPDEASWIEGLEPAREALASSLAERGRRLVEEGHLEEAADLMLEAVRRVGRRKPLGGALAELSSRYRDAARAILNGDNAFLHWLEAIALERKALRCRAGNSRALMELERLRGKEFVARTWGEAVSRAHAAGAAGDPVSPILEAIQDEGFDDEALEIIAESAGIRARLESEATLRSLALLHQRASREEDDEEIARIDGLLGGLDLESVNEGGRLLYLGSAIDRAGDGETRISLWFRVTARMQTDYKMFLHGYVKDRGILPEDRRDFEFANFDHEVRPPTSRWRPGAIVRHTWKGPVAPGEYRFLFGFFNSKEEKSLLVEGTKSAAVEIGWRTIPGSPGS